MAKRFFKLSSVALAVSATVASVTSNVAVARGPDLPVQFLGGQLELDGVVTGGSTRDTQRDGGNSLFLDIGFTGLGFAGEMTLNGISKTADFGDNTFRYGDRMKPGSTLPNARNQWEVYDFSATRLGEKADINLFYHVPRFHWGYEGDEFGLLAESTDIPKMDIFNDKAPVGAEIVGKDQFEGLKIVGGKQIYWGAPNSMIMAKYQFGDKDQYTFMADSDTADNVNMQRYALTGNFDLTDDTLLTVGLLNSGAHKKGDSYLYEKGSQLFLDEIDSTDALALKVKLSEKISGSTTIYTEFNYAGLVADAGNHEDPWDTELPYSNLGNKKTLELGARTISGNWMYAPRAFVRRNLVDSFSDAAFAAGNRRAISENPTASVTPFAVLGNRPVDAYEFYITYDTTPGTYFYDWDNYLKEDAPIAFNFGITQMSFKKGDSNVMAFDTGPALDDGRPAETVTKFTSRIGINPTENIRIYTDLAFGKQQPVFAVEPVTSFASVDTTLVHANKNVYTVSYAKDAYGDYDFQAEQGVNFSHQMGLGYERMLDFGSDGTKAGIAAKKRKQASNDVSSWELIASFTYAF